MDNKEIYNLFLNWVSIAHSPATVESYRWGLKVFVEWCDGTDKDILKLKEKDFVEYVFYLKEDRKVKDSTCAAYVCSVRTMWRWLLRQKLVADESIPLPKGDDKENYPFATAQEVELMLSFFNEIFIKQLRDKAIISFLFATGLRLGELLSLDAGDLDYGLKKGVVKTFKRRNHKREIYWTEDVNHTLKKWLIARDSVEAVSKFKSNALFVSLSSNTQGKRLQKSDVQKMIRWIRKAVGIERKLTAHSFRHGFGKKAVEQNVHPRHLQLMLGHAKLNTTMFYMGATNAEVEKIYREKMA